MKQQLAAVLNSFLLVCSSSVCSFTLQSIVVYVHKNMYSLNSRESNHRDGPTGYKNDIKSEKISKLLSFRHDEVINQPKLQLRRSTCTSISSKMCVLRLEIQFFMAQYSQYTER